MKKILLFVVFGGILSSGMLLSQTTYTWTGAATTTTFSDAGNWNPPGGPPMDGDAVVFDGNCTLCDCDLDVPITLSGFTMAAGYPGKFSMLTNNQALTVLDNFWVEAGTFEPADYSLSSNSLTFSMTTTGPSTFYINSAGGAIFNNNNERVEMFCTPGGTLVVDFDAGNFTQLFLKKSGSLSLSQVNFNFASSNSPGTQTLQVNSTVPVAFQGGIKVQKELNMNNATSTGNPSGSTGTITADGLGTFKLVGTSTNARGKLPNLVINKSASNFTFQNHVNFYNSAITLSVQGALAAVNHTINIHGNCSIDTPTNAPANNNNRFKALNLVVHPGSTLNLGDRDVIALGANTLSSFFSNSGTINGTSQSLLMLRGTGSQSITGSSSMTLGSVYLDNTNTRTITLNNNLTILDSLSFRSTNITLNTNNKLFLHSSNNLKAMVTCIGSGTGAISSINGNINVRTFAPGGTTGWTNLGVSGVSGNNLSAWDGQIPMTCNGCINGTTSAGGPFISVYRYDETQNGGNEYVPMTASSSLNPGEGYWVYLGNGQTTTSDMTWTVSGPAVQGSVSVNLTNTSGSAYPGFNLVANPYPSPVRFRELMAVGSNSSNITNVIYIYNPDLGLTTSYNGVTDISSHSNGAKDVIPMGQGFHLEATTNTSFVFAEVAKTPSNTSSNPLLKLPQSSPPSEQNTPSADNSSNSMQASIIRLTLNSNAGAWDETVVHFHPSATAQMDIMDARKIFPNSFNTSTANPDPKKSTISTRYLNEDYSINSIPVSPNGYTVPVLVKSKVSGIYTISITETKDIPNGVCVQLKDKFTNSLHNLLNSPYVFQFHDTTSTPRFDLLVCGGWVPTGVQHSPAQNTEYLQILKGENGFYFSGTKLDGSRICITNILGQILYENPRVHAPDQKLDLPFQSNEKLLIVTVETSSGKYTRKFIQ